MFKRKSEQLQIPDGQEVVPSKAFQRFQRLETRELIEAIEAELGRSGELLRGFSHRELDPAWVAAELKTHLTAAAAAASVLEKRETSKQTLS